jgi:hypothetical protein
MCRLQTERKKGVTLNVMKAYRRKEVWFLSFLTSTLDWVNGQLYVTADLFLGKNTRHPFNRMVGGNLIRYGRFAEEKNRLLLPGIESQIVQLVAQSLSRLIKYHHPINLPFFCSLQVCIKLL